MVAGDPPASRLFERVCVEVGRVVEVESVNITRFGDNGTQAVLGALGCRRGTFLPEGEMFPIDGQTVTAKGASTRTTRTPTRR